MTVIFILEMEYVLHIPCQTDNSPKCVNGSVLIFERIIHPILSVVSVKTAIKDIPLKQSLQWYFCQTLPIGQVWFEGSHSCWSHAMFPGRGALRHSGPIGCEGTKRDKNDTFSNRPEAYYCYDLPQTTRLNLRPITSRLTEKEWESITPVTSVGE